MAEMGYDFATQRNATQRNATQRNATQRNATQRNATQRNGITVPFFRIKIHIFVMDDRRARWENWLRQQAKEPLSGSTVFCVQA